MTDFLTVTREDGVMILTFNRPEKKNAITRAMYAAAAEAMEAAETDPGVLCVLLRGAGDCFTAGNDLGDFAAVNAAGDSKGPRQANQFIEMLAKVQKPYVASVHGLAVGIGVTMLLHCDLVYVAEDAKLSAPFVNLALVPEAASSILLTSRIGHAQAFAMFVLGEPITGLTAVANGLATAAVPAAEVYARALAAAKAVAKRPPGSVKATKMLMRDVEMIQARMKVEGEIFSARLKTAEAAEAFQAFAERRQPDFSKL